MQTVTYGPRNLSWGWSVVTVAVRPRSAPFVVGVFTRFSTDVIVCSSSWLSSLERACTGIAVLSAELTGGSAPRAPRRTWAAALRSRESDAV